MLEGKQWLREKHDVHVVSMYSESVAASEYVGNWLESGSGGSKVHRRVYLLAIDGNDEAVDELVAFAEHGHLYVIVDEVDGSEFEDFFHKLNQRVPHLNLWVARVFHDKIPNGMTDRFRLTKSLRCPAVIVSELQRSLKKWTLLMPVGAYSEDLIQPCEGPLARTLCHQGGQHTEMKPLNCETCGKNVASVLKELHVNEALSSSTTPGLRFSDVFVLTSRWAAFWDAETDDKGTETMPACGLIRGLRSAGVPVRVVRWDASSIDDVCSMTRPDEVVAAQVIHLSGLERKVVVWVPSRYTDLLDEEQDRLHTIGRCTGQLIKVIWPQPPSEPKLPVEELDLD